MNRSGTERASATRPAPASPNAAVTPHRSFDVLIVGAGVIGLSIAEALASEGLSIRVLEADRVGSGASGAAAGMLAPISEAAPDSPLLAVGLESLRRFAPLCARLREETGIDPEFEASGVLHAARHGAAADALRARCDRIEAAAASARWPLPPELEWLDEAALRAMQPDFAPGWGAGLLSPHEAHLRPPLLVRALEAAALRLGVRIDSGVRVHRLLVESDRVLGVESSDGPAHAATTILAAGVWTASLLDASGLAREALARARAIEPVRGQILALEAPLPRMSSIHWTDDAYFVPKRDGRLIVGATEESVGFDRRVTAEGVATLLAAARAAFPSLADSSFGSAWAGLRPVSSDGLPVVGRVDGHPGLLLAAGHGRNGVLLSPMTGRIVAEELLGKTAVDAARPFAPLPSQP